MSLPARSIPHSTTNVPALVLIVWPLLPGHTTDDVATGPVEVAVAPAPGVEDADDARVEVPAEDAPAEVDAAPEAVEDVPEAVELAVETSLAPQTPLLVLGAPRPFFR